MKLVKFTLTDSNGPVYVNPRQVVKVQALRAPGTAYVEQSDGWLVGVHGDPVAVEQALDSVKLLPCADTAPGTVTFTRVIKHVDMDAESDRPCPDVEHVAIEVAVDDVLCVTGHWQNATTVLYYLCERPGSPARSRAVELAELPEFAVARLEGRA